MEPSPKTWTAPLTPSLLQELKPGESADGVGRTRPTLVAQGATIQPSKNISAISR